jgi:hypothetical protein
LLEYNAERVSEREREREREREEQCSADEVSRSKVTRRKKKDEVNHQKEQ